MKDQRKRKMSKGLHHIKNMFRKKDKGKEMSRENSNIRKERNMSMGMGIGMLYVLHSLPFTLQTIKKCEWCNILLLYC